MTIRMKYISRFLEKLAGSAALLAILTVSTFASGDSGYGKPLRDYVDDYPYLLRHTAQASLYAYPSERNVSLKGSLEEDGWEVHKPTDHWVHIQNGSLNVVAYRGSTAKELLGLAVYSTPGYTDYIAGDFTVGVKQCYSDVFSSIHGSGIISDFIRCADDDCSFVFTGHSKGSAFAQIAGIVSLGHDELRQKTSVIGYGSPRIFSAKGSTTIGDIRDSTYGHSFLRVVKDGDPVCLYDGIGGEKGYNGGISYEVPATEEERGLAPATVGQSIHSMKGYLVSVYDAVLGDIMPR